MRLTEYEQKKMEENVTIHEYAKSDLIVIDGIIVKDRLGRSSYIGSEGLNSDNYKKVIISINGARITKGI